MAGALVGVAAQVVVGHEEETEPYREEQAQAPGQHHRPEDPVRHPQDQADVRGVAVVAEDVAGADAPGEAGGPDGHDEEPFPAGVAEQLLLLAGRWGRRGHRVIPGWWLGPWPRSSWVRIPILTSLKVVRIGILTHEERGTDLPLPRNRPRDNPPPRGYCAGWAVGSSSASSTTAGAGVVPTAGGPATDACCIDSIASRVMR